ncbi:GlxA family transcriptional regulator [Cochlodiniinecator piscidefendens]|uniref:GlxA family transcriptional regulator n=1 Tax=Cochlodiniinecator piscidefendens TaxID=2715756 RepID=UPI00140C320D|nr:GlxA family transcriptional regulator [Cochlodiniinecator piscidefendens]
MKTEKSIFSPSEHSLSVGILVLPDTNTLSFAATVDPLRAANRRAGKTCYQWQFFSFEGGEIQLTTGAIVPTVPLTRDTNIDVLIVVAAFELERHSTPKRLNQLRTANRHIKAIGAVDGGAWLLAKAGLLNNHQATMHWEDLELFASQFPDVDVVHNRFVIDRKFFTTGGASPCLDMMLHLIRHRQGPEIALRVASAFIYDPIHPADAPQSLMPLASTEAANPVVAQAIKHMEETLEDPPQISTIASILGVTPRTLELQFQKTLSISPARFFLNLRLQEARRLVEDSRLPLSEIAVRTGFNAQSTFARAFRAKFGQNATQRRNTAPPESPFSKKGLET